MVRQLCKRRQRRKRIVVTRKAVCFLGAGASAVGGLVPLTSNLLDHRIPFDGSIRRFASEERVRERWVIRQSRSPIAFEAWFSELQSEDPFTFFALQSLVAHRIALAMARRIYPRLHNASTALYRSTGSSILEALWATLAFFADLCIVTTNYDIVAERGLRAFPTRRRPGFNYGIAGEVLHGRTWPNGREVRLAGAVPIYKLHGSLSWKRDGARVQKWVDCRNAVKGSAFIVPPVMNKPAAPAGLADVWQRAEDAMRSARILIVIGYSAPAYDLGVRSLLRCVPEDCDVHVFDMNPNIGSVYQEILRRSDVKAHGPLPGSIGDLKALALSGSR